MTEIKQRATVTIISDEDSRIKEICVTMQGPEEPAVDTDLDDLIDVVRQFVRYAQNGNHPGWATYLQNAAGARMLEVLSRVDPQP